MAVYIYTDKQLNIQEGPDKLPQITIKAFTSKKKLFDFVKPNISYQAYARKIGKFGVKVKIDHYEILPLYLNE